MLSPAQTAKTFTLSVARGWLRCQATELATLCISLEIAVGERRRSKGCFGGGARTRRSDCGQTDFDCKIGYA